MQEPGPRILARQCQSLRAGLANTRNSVGPKRMTGLALVLTAKANQATLAALDSGIRELVLGTEYESSVLLLR